VLRFVAIQGAFKFVSFSGVFSEDCLSEASVAAARKTGKLATGNNTKHPDDPNYWHK